MFECKIERKRKTLGKEKDVRKRRERVRKHEHVVRKKIV